MPLSELSASTQNYLKAIWSLEEWSNMPATASALAERMGLRASSVSDGLKRLAAADLIEHQRYGTIELTELGRTWRSKRAHRSPRPLTCVLSHQRMQALHPPKPLLPRHRPPCHWGQLPQPTFSSPAPKNRPTMRVCYPCTAGLCCARWAARIRPSTP